ncbi:MAG: 2-C-methyl-D-erythritol 4-phosphate cytidylyltransferase [Brevinema sp.]
MKRKNVAVLLAGGTGSRVGLETPKQFLKIAGKTILEHTISIFEKNANIDEITIVASLEYHAYIKDMLNTSEYTKFTQILSNGSERYQSTLSAIKYYEQQPNINFLIHDVVRPLLSQRIINECVEALEKYQAINTVIPSTDTLIEVEDDKIVSFPQRSRFWKVQTPQCFHLDILKEAYEKALKDPEFETTDDCRTIHRYLPNIEIHLVKGEETNLKLTYLEDLPLLEFLLTIKNAPL